MAGDQEFLESIVRAIVNNPADVTVDRKVDEKGVLLTLHVNPQDMGYVVGRHGKTAESLRTLLRIVGAKNDARVSLQIFDPNAGSRPPREPRRSDEMGANTSPSPRRRDDVDTSAVDNLNI